MASSPIYGSRANVNNEIIYGFELALPPDQAHSWNYWIDFIPNDKEKVMALNGNEDMTVKGDLNG